jgi:AAA family ATP:ADP antiporter
MTHPGTPRYNRFVRAIREELLLREGEGRSTAYFLLLLYLVGLGLALGNGSANSLFLKRAGVAYLPYAYLGLSLALAAASILYAAWADRLAPERLFVALAFALCLCLAFLWSAMAGSASPFTFGAYLVLYEVFSELFAIHATLYFSANFDVGQSKRLLPVALAGQQGGQMTGGLGLTALAVSIDLRDVLLVWMGILAVVVALVAWHHRRYGASPYRQAPRRSTSPIGAAFRQVAQGLHFARRSALLRYSSIAVFFTVVAVYLLGYTMLAIYSGHFRSEAEFGILFGVITFVGGSVTLLIQLFFTGKLLRRFGVREINLVFPVTTLLTFGALLAAFKLPVALAGAFNRHVIMPSFRNPSRALLFQVLPDYMQGRARALSLGLVLPLAILVAGALAKLPGPEQASWALPLMGLAASAAYLYYSVLANRAYLGEMLKTLGEKLFIPREHLGRMDPSANAGVFESLSAGVMHHDEQVCVSYARALVDAFPDDAWRVVLPRLRTASMSARDQLVRIVAAHMPAAQNAPLFEHLETADAHHRATILSLLFEARDPRAAGHVEGCLGSDNPRLVACGIQGALEYGLDEHLPRARALWRELLGHARPEFVLSGLELLRRMPEPDHLGAALERAADADPRVRRAALAAITAYAAIDDPRLAALVERLAHSPDAAERAAAIACCVHVAAPQAVARAQAALDDPHPAVARAGLALLETVLGETFVAAALDWLAEGRLSPRGQAALLASVMQRPAPRVRLLGYARNKVGEAGTLASAWRVAHRQAGTSQAASRLFAVVLRERLEQAADLALMALGCAEDRALVGVIRAGIASRDARHLAGALESLDGLRHRDLARGLREAFEILRGGTTLAENGSNERFRTLEHAIEYFSQGTDAWLRECALAASTPAGGAAHA